LTLDSTISTLGVAIGNFVFDPTILGTGWRLISSTVSGVGISNVISQGNSNVTVTDVGSGLIQFTVDGNLITQIQNNRMDFQQTDIFGVKSQTFDNASGTSIFTQNNTTFDINFPTGGVTDVETLNVDFNSVTAFSRDTLRTRLHSITPNTLSSALSLFRDDPSPEVADALGDINFDGRDGAGNFTTYVDIIGGIAVPTTNIEEGRLTFRLQDSGSMQQAMRITLTELELTNMSVLMNEISLPSNPAADTGLIYLRDVAGTTTPFFLDSFGTETNMIAAGAGSQTPWTSNINGAGFALSNAGQITIKPIQIDGSEAELTLERNDTSPSDGDVLGDIFFAGSTDVTNMVNYAAIEVKSSDISDTAKQAELTISAQHDNTLTPIINYTGADAIFRFSTGVDVVRPNVNGTKELGTSSFFWDDVFSETFTLRGSGGNTTGTDRTIYADSAGMIFNMPTSAPVFTHSVNNSIFSLLSDGELEIRTALSDGPTLLLRNNDQPPMGGSNGPKLFFNANDNALTEFTYGSIIVNTTSVLAGFKNATMEFRNMASNSLDPFMNFLGANDKINMFKFLDMNNNYIEFDDILDPGAPASTERIIFSDSSNSAHLSIRTNSGVIDLEAAGSGANQQLSNLSGTTAVNLDLNLSSHSVTFDGSVELSGSSSGLRLDLASNDSFRIFTNSVQSHFFSNFVNNIIRTSDGTQGPVFQLTLDSSSPADDDILGSLVYGGRDTAGNLQTYAEIRGISEDVTSASENGRLSFFVTSGTGTAVVEALTLRSISSLPVVGFFGDNGTVKPTIQGSRGGNAALTDLLSSLHDMGLIQNSTTA